MNQRRAYMPEQPWDLKSTRALLQEHQQAAGFPKVECPGSLKPSEIKAYPFMFQRRTLGKNTRLPSGVTDAGLFSELVGSLRNNQGKPFSPLDIWWSGEQWVVVNGHHRLAAYRQSDDWLNTKVPVRAVIGGLQEALVVSVGDGAKPTRSLTGTEKSNAAFRLVCEGFPRGAWGSSDEVDWVGFTKEEIAQRCGRGTSIVAKMRSRLRECSGFSQVSGWAGPDDLAALGWATVNALDFLEKDGEQTKFDQEAYDARVEEVAEAISKEFPRGFRKQSEVQVLGDALAGLPGNILQRLAAMDFIPSLGEDPDYVENTDF